MNYPKKDIDKITDDFKNEYTFMRNLDRLSSVANFKIKDSTKNPKAKDDIGFSEDEQTKKRKRLLSDQGVPVDGNDLKINCK
jgi:hypothetical protein